MTTQTTSRLGELGRKLAGSRDYTLHPQSVELRDDRGTSEMLYSIVNRSTGVVEARLPDMPNALTTMVRLQSCLQEARTNTSGVLDIYDEENPAN